jgi:hypothetical protein
MKEDEKDDSVQEDFWGYQLGKDGNETQVQQDKNRNSSTCRSKSKLKYKQYHALIPPLDS